MDIFAYGAGVLVGIQKYGAGVNMELV